MKLIVLSPMPENILTCIQHYARELLNNKSQHIACIGTITDGKITRNTCILEGKKKKSQCRNACLMSEYL